MQWEKELFFRLVRNGTGIGAVQHKHLESGARLSEGGREIDLRR